MATQTDSWLESFPPDIWAHFVCFLPGEELGRLMFTGAKSLWQRLKSPTVVKSIKFGEDFIRFKSPPKFLNQFPSLEKLLFHSSSDDWCVGLGLKLSSIPSGLKKLKLRGVWRVGGSKLFEAENIANHLPRMEVLDLYPVELKDLSWLSCCPPTLTKLVLNRWDGTVELPSSLIHFKSTRVELTNSFIGKLPPRLETFESHDSKGIERLIHLLPASSLRLSLRGPILPVDVGKLPRSLTSLIFNFSDAINQVAFLPTTLTELDIQTEFPSSVWPLLPRQLTQLTFKAPVPLTTLIPKLDGAGHHGVTSYPFDLLPRSITSLQLFPSEFSQYFCGPPVGSHHSYFPPQLTRLQMKFVQLAPETAKLLPSSITHLEIGNGCENVVKHLPSGIKSLRCEKTLLSPNLLANLPKFMTHVSLFSVSPNDPWFDCTTGEMIDAVSKLPEYSIHEKCMSDSFDWKNSHLPSTLTYLHMGYFKKLGDPFLVHHRLPNILNLTLNLASRFTDLSIPLLSPHLISLDLGGSGDISGKCFPHLPRSLLNLILSNSESIFDCDIQHLPKSLKCAVLSRAIHLTDLCVTDFPPRLESLDLYHNTKITPASFPKFPCTIRSSQNKMSARFSQWRIQLGSVCDKADPYPTF